MLAFAGARDILGSGEMLVDLEAPCTAEQLLGRMCNDFPALSPYRRSIRVAINGAYAKNEEMIAAGDEVALIPPVAGG
ncbi:MoaD/ThiS family protein [Polyangium aurulentum]|nr:MoaD/ThiS family protein [Polyangium aurulentum]